MATPAFELGADANPKAATASAIKRNFFIFVSPPKLQELNRTFYEKLLAFIQTLPAIAYFGYPVTQISLPSFSNVIRSRRAASIV